MFKFVHAWHPGDSWEPLSADGFIGVERIAVPTSESIPPGIPVVGVDRSVHVPPTADDEGESNDDTMNYVIDMPCHMTPAAELGGLLAWTASFSPQGPVILVTNTGSPRPATRLLWDVLEAANFPNVKAALDIAAAEAVGERAAVLVPTLNLRIGLVRARQVDSELTDYARRLAGIGFDGYVVTDPPAGPDRAAASLAIAAAFRDVLPQAKPVKKAPAKVTK